MKQAERITYCTVAALLFAAALLSLPAAAQDGSIAGVITDAESKSTLPGANVQIEGTEEGASSGSDGAYEITGLSPGTYTVVATFVGYDEQSKEVDVQAGEETEVNFALSPSAMEMQEVEIVAVGYGEQERRDVTGAVSTVSGAALEDNAVTSVDRALQGQVAGVYVGGGRSKPGDEAAQVRIRGSRSISAGNEPLYVVDGVPLTGGLRDLNTQNIESIEVLKGPSSTAIYGSRGANGVVLVTTARGYDGQTAINYSSSAALKTRYKELDVFNATEFAEYVRESRRAVGAYTTDEALFEQVELESLAQGRYSDWPNLLVENGLEQSHQLNVVGGGETAKFNVSFGAFVDDGVIPRQQYQRYTSRVNLDVDVNDWFRLGTSTLGSYSIQDGNDLNPYFEAAQTNPLGPVYEEDGSLRFLPTADGQQTNPLNEVVPGALIDEETRYRLLSQIYAELDFTENLQYRLNFSPDLIQRREGNFQASLTNTRRFAPPAAQSEEDFVFNYTIDNIVTYNNTFADVHDLDLTGLFSIQTRRAEGSSMSVRGIPVESMRQYNFGAAEEILGTDSFYEKWSLISYMGRINYGYDDRYLLTATARLDGSSRFGEDNKYGLFPSVAFAWNIDNEGFMQNQEVFSSLRARLSYGQSGNTAIDPYQTAGLLGRTTYSFGETAGYGYRPNQLSNSQLQWEATSSYNLALEFGVLNERVTGSVDVYLQNTDDLLLQRQLPFSSGFGSVFENVGATRNRGVEFQVSTVNIQNSEEGGFRWTTDFNMAYNKTEIRRLFGGQEDDVGNEWFIGEPINVFYDYEKIGIWQQDQADLAESYGQEPGEVRVRDQNDDGLITGEDRVILGRETPNWTGGFNSRISYGGFDFSVFLVGQFGNMIQSDLHDALNTLAGRYNNLDVDYWTPNNQDAPYPRPNQNQEFPIYGSTLSYFSGSFVRIRDVTLGYNLPSSLLGAVNVEALRLYLSANRPYVFSPYVQDHQGLDPEYTGLDSPPTRSFEVGLDLTL